MENETEPKTFATGERVMQIFLAHNGAPVIVKYDVVESTTDSLTLVAIEDAGEMTGKTITFTKEQGIPRTYRGSDTDRMFSEYVRYVERLPAAVMNAGFTLRDLNAKIATLRKISELWSAAIRKPEATSATSQPSTHPENPTHAKRIVNS